MNNWISIEDKLPGNRRNVLTIYKQELYWVGWYDIEKNKWFTFDPGDYDSDEHTIDVDHWMELPQPTPEEY